MISGSDNPDPPGAVSNQNQEEAEGGLAGGQQDPGTRPDEESAGDAGGPSENDSADSAPGSATEGSQATGHPENAG